jgi:hypothetical protein
MPYPFSINKNFISDLDKNSILNELIEELKSIGTQVDLKDDNVKMTWSIEFSSGITSFKEFNKGQIKLVLTDEGIKLHFRIILVEHLVIFLFLIAIGVYGLFDSGLDSIMVKVTAILLTANFVFCYLFPLMALNSFIHNFNKRTKNK